MHERTVVITGADGDIGAETARGIARQGARILMACLDPSGARPLRDRLIRETGNPRIEIVALDLASLERVRACAAEIAQRVDRLDVLIKNAGVYCHRHDHTVDGFERTMGINYLGPFLLTHLLLPQLQAAPAARIINVASNAYRQGRVDPEDLHAKKRRYQGFRAYANSKMAVVLWTSALASRLSDSAITVNVLHPGHVASSIWDIWPGTRRQRLLDLLITRLMQPPAAGAANSVYLATSDEIADLTGCYFEKWAPVGIDPRCRNRNLQQRLYRVSRQQTGIDPI